ncbi:hypothetical protein [Methylobacterium iners]|uniref:Uncharacterized protein n=1 Tax=Methylobacterium iners TaxID=418707 RepID=A0ABQ4RRR8_9HYPH|nr:hypothetical protein [Methylobacterium iners]GJD92872.1 hypothetical protein OCOJLMKI_0055 [Methylobacterium iners]
MTAPSLILAARHAPDRRQRILLMAETMRDHAWGPEGACTDAHLRAAGFTEGEIATYPDDARAVLVGKPSPLRTVPAGRLNALALAKKARSIRSRIEEARRG